MSVALLITIPPLDPEQKADLATIAIRPRMSCTRPSMGDMFRQKLPLRAPRDDHADLIEQNLAGGHSRGCSKKLARTHTL